MVVSEVLRIMVQKELVRMNVCPILSFYLPGPLWKITHPTFLSQHVTQYQVLECCLSMNSSPFLS